VIVVVDYNAGNLRSIQKALQLYSNSVVVSDKPEDILSADKIVLPGVGNFGKAMEHISEKKGDLSIGEAILESINKVPFLGICLGMQLLMESSEECPNCLGFGVFEGNVIKFRNVEKIPHMGWNSVNLVKDMPLFEGIKNNEYFYFVHSYYVNPKNLDEVVGGTSDYGTTFPCILNKDDIYATQFHPEKSGKIGLKVIKNFIEL